MSSRRINLRHFGIALLGLAALPLLWSTVGGCPFCVAPSQTLSEELAGMDVSVIATLVEPAEESELSNDAGGFGPADADTGMATFEVTEVIRGDEHIAADEEIEVVYFGSGEASKRFLINGIAGASLDWATPLPLSDRGVEYIKQLEGLPEKGADRLAYFQQYLEDEDPLLAQDAYDEFAKAPYDEVIALADRMDPEQLMHWIESPEVGPTHRRLYLTMLGVCGDPTDAEQLESLLQYDYQLIKPGLSSMISLMGLNGGAGGVPIVDELMRADVRRKQQCLDALVAAYLKLKGPDGLPLIEQKFLDNPAADYTQVYATIMALRFHGEETDVIPRERLLESLHLVLDNQEIADQVIPDLARWEDWSVMDRLVGMFQSSEEDDWIRQPVISYLITATEQPGEVGTRATTALEEIEEIDPEGVKRARSYMAFGLLSRLGTKKEADASAGNPPALDTTEPSPTAENAKPREATTAMSASEQASDSQTATAGGAGSAAAQAADETKAPSRLLIIGVPILAGLLLMGIFALLLRGGDVRSYSDAA